MVSYPVTSSNAHRPSAPAAPAIASRRRRKSRGRLEILRRAGTEGERSGTGGVYSVRVGGRRGADVDLDQGLARAPGVGATPPHQGLVARGDLLSPSSTRRSPISGACSEWRLERAAFRRERGLLSFKAEVYHREHREHRGRQRMLWQGFRDLLGWRAARGRASGRPPLAISSHCGCGGDMQRQHRIPRGRPLNRMGSSPPRFRFDASRLEASDFRFRRWSAHRR